MSLASGTELRYLSYDRFGHVFNDFTVTLMYFSFSAGKGEGSFMLWTTTRPFEKEIDSQHKRRADNHPAPIVACGAARKARKGGGLAGIRAVIVAVAVGGGARPSAAGLGPNPGAARGARAVHRREGRAALCDEGGGRVVDFILLSPSTALVSALRWHRMRVSPGGQSYAMCFPPGSRSEG
jgi:hypothetical protein